jgi:putative CocE/NonD family hydrolase
MSIASEILGRRMRLIASETHAVTHEPDLAVTADDGVTLLADRWVATAGRDRPQPTVLVRSPYGRTGFVGLMFGRMLAERGLQVVVQSVRGTFGSGGDFTPFDERADGLATLRWLRAQPWHRDRIGTFGPSYLGLVQWALAADAGEDLAAMAIQVSASQFFDQTYAGGGMSLETAASWMALMTAQESRLAPLAINRAVRGLAAAMSELPLGDLDERATGAIVPWYREAFSHPERDDPYWAARDFSARRSEITAPVSFVGGWYDIFLPWMLADHAVLAAAGAVTRLTIGPWAHTSPGLAAAGHRDGIAWLRAHLLDDRRLLSDSPVRIRVTGERSGDGWRDLPAWPPPGTGERPMWLGESGRLQDVEPATSSAGADGYRYDPADPTPAIGGPILLSRDPVVDNRALEARDDVLVYTGETLAQTFEAVGDVRVELYVSADSDFFDLFARVCDVDGGRVSRNVCDALARVAPGRFERDEDGIWRVGFALWPLAHRFAAGHRIRLQISSGAHPRYARNPGTGEDLGTSTRMRPVSVEIHRGERRPSAVVLPTVDSYD